MYLMQQSNSAVCRDTVAVFAMVIWSIRHTTESKRGHVSRECVLVLCTHFKLNTKMMAQFCKEKQKVLSKISTHFYQYRTTTTTTRFGNHTSQVIQCSQYSGMVFGKCHVSVDAKICSEKTAALSKLKCVRLTHKHDYDYDVNDGRMSLAVLSI